ncbi:hypothetical protein PGB90_008471 [Kerria lacca]
MDDIVTNADETPPKKKNYINFIPYLLIFCTESSVSFCSYIYRDIEQKTSPALFVNTTTAIQILGAIFAGILMEICGRKRSIQLTFLLIITGMTLMFLMFFIRVERFIFHFVGYLIIKFAVGMEVSAIVYVAETCSPERLAFRMSFLMPFMYFGIYAPKFIHIFFLQNLLSINEQNEILIIIAIAIIFFYLSKYFPEYTEYLNNENGKLDIDRDLPKNDFTHIELSISSDQKNTLQGLNSETDYVLKISDVIALISSIVAVIFTKKFKQEKVLMVSGIGILILCGAGALYEYIFLNVPGQFKPTRFCLIPVICIWLSEALIIVGFSCSPKSHSLIHETPIPSSTTSVLLTLLRLVSIHLSSSNLIAHVFNSTVIPSSITGVLH